MPPQTLASRVDRLERRVESLEALAEQIARLETQFLQFREEARSAFSAVRAGIRARDEETQRLMRVLHEDVIARLSLIE
jgi:outer membrane murein-binding lipoprotein Lpp